MLRRLSCPRRSTDTGMIAIIVDDVVCPHEEPRARPELDRDETNVAKPRARPKLDRDVRWALLVNILKKVAKRKRLGNALFNTLNPTHSDFLANFPMTGQMLPELRRRCRAAFGGRA